MKSTGIVRKLDELGRITLPIELRRTLDVADRDPIEIAVATLVGNVAHRVARVEAQRIEVDADRTFRLAASAHQTVACRRERERVMPSVAQEIDRLYVVYPQF